MSSGGARFERVMSFERFLAAHQARMDIASARGEYGATADAPPLLALRLPHAARRSRNRTETGSDATTRILDNTWQLVRRRGRADITNGGDRGLTCSSVISR
jgi:hypothetical protein